MATGTDRLYVKNLDTTNSVRIGFGTSYATAETDAATSINIGTPYIEFYFTVPAGATHYTWLGVGGTVSVVIGMAD